MDSAENGGFAVINCVTGHRRKTKILIHLHLLEVRLLEGLYLAYARRHKGFIDKPEQPENLDSGLAELDVCTDGHSSQAHNEQHGEDQDDRTRVLTVAD